ncbi:MAG TPA: type IV secretion system protein, partial [Ktedonobacteraceae bacterium]|nr:type IV secretion system protein [Ktedonobacteraceae bacterium]
MDPTLLNNLLASLRNTIFDVLTQNGTPFQQLGQNIFRTLAIVMIVIAGSRIAFSDHHALHKLRTLAGLLLLVWIMITLYSTPSPLLGGYSFSEAIPKTAFGMADLVGTTTQQQMLSKLNDISTGIQDMGEFSMLHARDFIIYLLITLLIAVLELAMFIVVGFGYLALGAILIIGPILIPFVLVPKLDFLFWSWLKALIKYSFY